MLKRISICATVLSFMAALSPAAARTRCETILARFEDRLAEPVCFESDDLTTANAQTTPPDNSNPSLPAGAWTPRTDRNVIAPDALNRTPITKKVKGVQIQARIASDPLGQARFLLRLPDVWNGRLVVAGASGTRSEFNSDFAWSDYVVQKGYAYASQNKGVLNLFLPATQAADPLACRLNPTTPVYVHFFDDDPGQQFTRWAAYMAEGARLARRGVQDYYGREPRYTYAVGTSNGGYQVRRAIESYPELFDGGVDWEGTFVDDENPNLLTDLPPAILNFPDYMASAFNAGSTAAKNIQAAGYPPDVVFNGFSLWGRYNASFWEVTQCQWQKRLDPTYDTYVSGTGTYNYHARRSVSDVGAQIEAFETTGKIRRPLLTVAGTLDALLPIDHHARAYARKVAEESSERRGDDGERDDGRGGGPAYRLYEVQNGNHIETYKSPPQLAVPPPNTFPQLEFIEPHAQRAFDVLIDFNERGVALPSSQCIPRGGAIEARPAQPGHCARLSVP